jgi:hypothetical protein
LTGSFLHPIGLIGEAQGFPEKVVTPTGASAKARLNGARDSGGVTKTKMLEEILRGSRP